ncbi:MAG: glycosyl transferase [candidate division Zixibacteria bacterium]|nr:glycosyl transferase [candidate division Zixibacteria bacterium]
MGDFFQNGIVATFHRLGQPNLSRLEDYLVRIAKVRGISLVLPSLYSELEQPALAGIVQELRGAAYLREIVVTLGPCSSEEFQTARRYFSILPQKTTLLWVHGPRMEGLLDLIRSKGLDPGPDGKGKQVWLAYGYVLSEGQSDVIALHDCDIVTYSRELLARLIYPVASPQLDFEFCKGYYSRVTNNMHGRVMRLLAVPLIRALITMVGPRPSLEYYDSFRYILSGEFSMMANLARLNRVPADWGLEIGVLAEIYRNCSVKRICQVELCENYEHKHQALSAGDKTAGLHRMAIDIANTLFATLAAEDVIYSSGFFNSLRATYRRIAQDMILRYEGDAMLNGLEYDRHEESRAVEMFTEAIQTAGSIVDADPLGPRQIPNWNRIFSAIPDFSERLLEAVRLDNMVADK